VTAATTQVKALPGQAAFAFAAAVVLAACSVASTGFGDVHAENPSLQALTCRTLQSCNPALAAVAAHHPSADVRSTVECTPLLGQLLESLTTSQDAAVHSAHSSAFHLLLQLWQAIHHIYNHKHKPMPCMRHQLSELGIYQWPEARSLLAQPAAADRPAK
jgi:hypothetical protein